MYKITSTHPLAQTVAREFGATVKVEGDTVDWDKYTVTKQ